MSIPLKDDLLVAYATNFQRLLAESSTTYHISSGQVAEYSALCDVYVEAARVMWKARASGVRSSAQTTATRAAKAALLPVLRALYAQIQTSLQVSDPAKVAIGVYLPTGRKPRKPAPTSWPNLSVVSVVMRSITISIRDSGQTVRGRKADNATHAYVYSFLGERYPDDLGHWRFHGETTTDRFTLQMPHTTPAGAVVQITAVWVSASGKTGPQGRPVTTCVQGGGATKVSKVISLEDAPSTVAA